MNASRHDHDDARGAAASEEAAAPSEAVEQVASDGDAPDVTCPEPAENHQHAVELDLEELVARAEKADEYLDLAQRTKADFENFRKRSARDAAAAQTRGVSKLARELLPAIDNLDRALAAASTTAAGELASGIKLVHDEILAAFGRAGIEPFSPEGEPFDPQQHEAVAQLPAEEAEPGTVIEVYQRGYRLGEAVLRPARVSVAG
jgi:molecular chaperone GrpE